MNISKSRFRFTFQIPITVLILLSLASCGGGSSSGSSSGRDNGPKDGDAYLEISSSTRYGGCAENEATLDCHVTISGEVFNEHFANSQVGDCDSHGPIGVTVNWENLDTGDDGAAHVRWACDWLDLKTAGWSADIPLDWGKNEIVFTARGTSGRFRSEKVIEHRDIKFVIEGEIKGLLGDGLILQNNGGQTQAVAGFSFAFPDSISEGDSYSVLIYQQPTGQNCIVQNGSGTMNREQILSGEEVMDIKILCRGWELAELVEYIDGTSFGEPRIAIGETGNALAIWTSRYDGEDSKGELWGSHYDVDVGWGIPVKIEANANGQSFNPQLVIDPAGNSIVVWEKRDTSDDSLTLWYSEYTVGTGWSTPEQIVQEISASSGTGQNPRLVIDNVGNVLVMWKYYDGSRSHRRVMGFYPGSGWGPMDLISQNPEGVIPVTVEFDKSGNLIALWFKTIIHDTGWHQSIIWARRYSINNGWENGEVIGESANHIIKPQIVFDDSGNALVVWKRGSVGISATKYMADVGWLPDESLGSYSSNTPPEIAIGSNGNAMVAWPGALGIGVYHHNLASGSSLTELLPKNSSNSSSQTPQIAICDGDNALVVWSESNMQDNDRVRESVYSQFYTEGSGWGPVELLATVDGGQARYPQVAFDAECNALAVWQQSEARWISPDGSIWANRYKF